MFSIKVSISVGRGHPPGILNRGDTSPPPPPPPGGDAHAYTLIGHLKNTDVLFFGEALVFPHYLVHLMLVGLPFLGKLINI